LVFKLTSGEFAVARSVMVLPGGQFELGDQSIFCSRICQINSSVRSCKAGSVALLPPAFVRSRLNTRLLPALADEFRSPGCGQSADLTDSNSLPRNTSHSGDLLLQSDP